MKDFKNPNLYKLEQGTFSTFVDSMLETNTEYNQSGRLRTGLVEEEEESSPDMFSSIDDWGSMGASDDFGSFDFSSGLDNYSADTSDKLLNPRGYTVEEMGTMRMLLTAPIYALQQTSDAVINTKKINQATRKKIAKDWRIWGLSLGGFSLLGLFPFVTSFIYLPVGVGMIATAGLADYYYGKKGGDSIIQRLVNGDEADFEGDSDEEEKDEESDGLDLGSGDGGSGFGDFGGFGGFGGFGDDDTKDETLNDRYSEFVDDESGAPSQEDEYYDPESMGSKATDYFPESPIDTETTESFREGLVDVYKAGIGHKGKMLYNRTDMVKYYAKYMPNNDKAFARWTTIREHSPEYDNIAYTIYKSLVSVNGKFDMRTAVPAGEKLTVMEMKRTPLIFKITIKLPSYFKINDVTSRSNIFNDMLKATDDDEKVGTIMTTYSGDLVIKFLRLDYKKLVAMGDLLRLSNEDSAESFAEQFATNKGIPMVAGMRDNEYPYMVDIVGNPAASVVGGSGSGKSWLTFQFMDSMLIANNPEHLNFLILDAKDASIWKQFALAPHVIGYHSDYHDFINILMEVKAEHERRMKELSRMGIESWKDYSDRSKRSGEHGKLAEMPLLFVIIDEITYTMSSLQNEDIDQYKELKNLLTQLSSVIRASGIRMMLIGQRAIDTSIPKGYLANSPLKLGMKMNVQSDFTTMLGKGYDREVSRIPSGPGEGIMLAEGQTKPSYVKTVIPGGTSDGDILMQVRVMALDWVRRTQGTQYDYTTLYNDMRTTIKKGFNRDMYYNQAIVAVQEGRITDPVDADEGYLISVNSPNADLLGNAMENVERKLSKSETPTFIVDDEPEVAVNDKEEEELPVLDEFDWGSLLEEPEDREEQAEPELDYTEPELDYPEPELDYPEPEVELEMTLEDTTGTGTESEEYDLTDYGTPEVADYTETTDNVASELDYSTFGNTELEIEEYVPTPEPKEVELETEEVEPEPAEVVTELEVEDTPQKTREMPSFNMSIDDLLEQEERDKGLTGTESTAFADEEDISTMLDIASETIGKQAEVPYEETEEYQQFKQEQAEMEDMRIQQQAMLDMLQKQQEEHKRKLEEGRIEAERKAKEELKQQQDMARAKRVREGQQRLQEQKAELEKQKQEILRMQQEIEASKKPAVETPKEPAKEMPKEKVETPKPLAGVTPEPKYTPVPKVEPKPKPKAEVKKEIPTPTKEVEKPKVVKKEETTPKAVPRAKPVKRKKVESSLKDTPPNTVSYNEMENMSVSQYIAKFGEVADGGRRLESKVIKAKFNRRKVSLSIAVGEVYEEGDYFYYIG